MSSTAYKLALAPIESHVSSVETAELFPDSIEAAFDRIEKLSQGAGPNQPGPSKDNLEWAKKVLLRVLPRYYLLSAEIDAFQREIHVNWENGSKRVTVFLPMPLQLKIYREEVKDQKVEHQMQRAMDPWEVSEALRWLFA